MLQGGRIFQANPEVSISQVPLTCDFFHRFCNTAENKQPHFLSYVKASKIMSGIFIDIFYVEEQNVSVTAGLNSSI